MLEWVKNSRFYSWEYCREWLKHNKIFFEVVVMLALTSMSLLVGFSANQIASSQLDVEKANHQPVFEFNQYIDESKSYMLLSVVNTGYPIESVDIDDPIVLFQIHYTYENQTTKTTSFVLEGYFYSLPIVSTGNELSRFGNVLIFDLNDFSNLSDEMEDGNYYKYKKLAAKVLLTKTDNLSMDHCDLCVYDRITYRDMYGEPHEEMYNVGTPFSYKIQSDQIEDKLEFAQELEEKGYVIDLDNWSYEQIYDKIIEENTPSYLDIFN